VLSAAIMTHPKRFDRSQRLPEQFPEWNLRVVTEPFPERPPASIRTARAAWGAVDRGATHHLVIQDDVDFPADFFRHVVAAAARHPEAALAFFAEWGCRTSSVIRIAALRGASWAEVVDEYIPAQALLLPAEAARGAARFMATLPDIFADDKALHWYLAREGLPQLVSVPNLVQHADVPCLTRNARHGPRWATCYSPESAAAGLSGETAVRGLTWVPYYAWWNQRAESCVRSDERSVEWRLTGTTAELAVALDRPASSLELACTASLRRHSTDFLEAGLVHQGTLRQLWFTALALGVVAAEGAQPITEETLRSRTVMLALASFVPGALRTVLRSQDLARATRDLIPAMCEAVHAGILLGHPRGARLHAAAASQAEATR
jgi:hypothetical protein